MDSHFDKCRISTMKSALSLAFSSFDARPRVFKSQLLFLEEDEPEWDPLPEPLEPFDRRPSLDRLPLFLT